MNSSKLSPCIIAQRVCRDLSCPDTHQNGYVVANGKWEWPISVHEEVMGFEKE